VHELSIVIPDRNGGDLLALQLDALHQAIGARTGIEVVVSDNGSTDDTAALARSYDDRLDIRVIDASLAAGINVARNAGVRAAASSRLLLCDADDEVDSAWIEAMMAGFDDGAELLAGPIDYRRLNDERLRQWRGADGATVHESLGFLPAGHGSNMGFTRALFDAIGGFDESFRYGAEDTEFFWRAQLAGFTLSEVPDAVVHYRLRAGLRSLWHQWFHYAAAEAQLAVKFGSRGLRRRNTTAPLADLWWIISRAVLSVDPGRRGAWVRRVASFCGRIRGSLQRRVLWW